MLREKRNRFRKAGLAAVNKMAKLPLCALLVIMMTVTAGCGSQPQTVTDTVAVVTDSETDTLKEPVYDGAANNYNYSYSVDVQKIAAIYCDIYKNAIETDTPSLETARSIIATLGAHGYVAVDNDNQIDMTRAEQTAAFCKAVDAKENAELAITVVMDSGFKLFDFKSEEGAVNIVRGYYQYVNGTMQNMDTAAFTADSWQYTEEGYLLFEGNYFSESFYVLLMSDESEQAALRVQPLDETCRELNRRYMLPVGYRKNNMFLFDWNETDFGDLKLYDLFDSFYPMAYGQPVPYPMDDNLSIGAVYRIPEELFEQVIQAYVNIDSADIQSRTTYFSEDGTYEYKPRGFYELESDTPYPEVVGYRENQDGTIALTVNAVYPNETTAKAFSHEVVVRPLHDGTFRYVSNQMLSPENDYDALWHSERLTADEWEELYGGNKPEPETETESSLWFLPQAEKCLITKAEKEELKNTALAAAEQVKEVYKDVVLTGNSSYGSNIKAFTEKQRKDAVALLGKAGFVSVSENINMENYGKLEDFYAAYMEKRDAMVTVFDVNPDGLIGAVTFLYREGGLQTYYMGIRWKEGGIPEIGDTLTSDIAEIKLTEKGYFIYAYKDTILHSSLRQYWRVKPLSDKCRELTAKYVQGLSYVNYNVLVTDWDSSNVEDILMPCMFEDIYRIDTGENLKAENWKIPAETYERIMTTYFPVTVEQLRKKCGYDEDSDSYEYEMILASPYPPFGEVVQYTENPDGTITLIADGVWPDYNSDLAFTNTIVVQPFADGTFRYLSNSIEQKELELPPIAGKH